MGAPAAGAGAGACATTAMDSPCLSLSSASSTTGERRDDCGMTVPIPFLSNGAGSKGTGATAVGGRPGLTPTGGGRGGHRLRPAAAVRFRCLEGALRSLLDTRSVFDDAGIDVTDEVVGVAGAAAAGAAAASQQEERLRRLLESVAGRLPKVLQALARSSVEMESSPSSSSPAAATFKSMYRTSLLAMREGGGGARAMLARLATEYGAVVGGEVVHDG